MTLLGVLRELLLCKIESTVAHEKRTLCSVLVSGGVASVWYAPRVVCVALTFSSKRSNRHVFHDANLRKFPELSKDIAHYFVCCCLYGFCLNSLNPLFRMCLNNAVRWVVALSWSGRALSGGACRSLAGGCKGAGGWCQAPSPQQTLAPSWLVRSLVGASLRSPRPPRYARTRPQRPPLPVRLVSLRALRSSPYNFTLPATMRVKDY